MDTARSDQPGSRTGRCWPSEVTRSVAENAASSRLHLTRYASSRQGRYGRVAAADCASRRPCAKAPKTWLILRRPPSWVAPLEIPAERRVTALVGDDHSCASRPADPLLHAVRGRLHQCLGAENRRGLRPRTAHRLVANPLDAMHTGLGRHRLRFAVI